MEILSVLLAALGCFASGAVYYTVLSKPWLEASGIDPKAVNSKDKTPFIIMGISALLSAGMMRHILTMNSIDSLGKAALIGAGIGAFFVGSWIFLNNGFEGKRIKLSVINTGYAIIALAIEAVILTLM